MPIRRLHKLATLVDSSALEEGLRLGEAGVWRWKLDSEQLEWSSSLEGLRFLATRRHGGYADLRRDVHPEDAAAVWQEIRESIATGKRYKTVFRTAPRKDAPSTWIEATGGVTVAADGSRSLTGICLDVTDRVDRELALRRRLDQQSAVASFGSFALNEPDLQKVLEQAVRVAADVLQVPLTKILRFADSADHLLLAAGLGWTDGLVGQGTVGIERSSQAGYTLLSSEPVIVEDLLTETRFDGPQLLHDHDVRSGISVIIPGVDVRPFGVFGIHARDRKVFDQNDAEFLQSLANIVSGAVRQEVSLERQRLLVREMAHRAGNLLQLVTSIARQTFATAGDARAAQRSFSERLGALAKSNYVVSRGGWTATRFAEVVEEALSPFGSRVETKGRDILLPPDLCFDMGIVLHELATNSVKYGTLGLENGAVTASWSNSLDVEGESSFCFVWEDPQSHGRAAPSGAGFGSLLVEALVEQKWRGRIELGTEPHFCIKLEIPLGREI